ncbi:MAG TPA: hypothetical protein IGS53_03250 [Leptolyngbyaceae cyanobacterium M33_DOE_097]|nr:hypothetical protein [Leptolyngbyaceae cyanobacterium M33_DOE_097]
MYTFSPTPDRKNCKIGHHLPPDFASAIAQSQATTVPVSDRGFLVVMGLLLLKE